MLEQQIIDYKTKSHTTKDFYRYHCEESKGNNYNILNYDLYKNILFDYFKFLRDQIIENGKWLALPARFGSISVRKFKSKPGLLQIDYKTTKELQKLTYLLNEHSDGYRYKFYWDKRQLMIKNCTKYQMIFCRANKRRLASIVKNRERDYIQK